jgi:hypothetical protein
MGVVDVEGATFADQELSFDAFPKARTRRSQTVGSADHLLNKMNDFSAPCTLTPRKSVRIYSYVGRSSWYPL